MENKRYEIYGLDSLEKLVQYKDTEKKTRIKTAVLLAVTVLVYVIFLKG